MVRKTLQVTALVATALLFTQRASVVEPAQSYGHSAVASQQRRSSEGEASAGTANCGIGHTCDALVPFHETGPWAASCSWFGTNAVSAPPRGESVALEGNNSEKLGNLEEDWCLQAGARLQFLIVTVPDPVTTHLGLYFDRSIEAIERAARQYDLYLARYWLPWQLPGGMTAAGASSQDLRVSQILEDYRSGQPGVLIFTGPPSGDLAGAPRPSANAPGSRDEDSRLQRVTFVFLVGESPTEGINKSQFKNAASYATTLCGQVGKELCPRLPEQVVGPFFSGSVPSAIDLQAYLRDHDERFDFVSGSMSSGTQVKILRDNGMRSFDDMQQGDESAEQVLFEFLQQQGLTGDGSNVAILQEDETGFSGMLFSNTLNAQGPAARLPPGVVQLTFPRDLSRLRNASSDTFAQPVAVPGTVAPPTQGLAWNWRDLGKGEDRVPSFSGGQEALSLQSVLLSISDVIRQRKIKYVGIVATDIFDILYLSKFLKVSVPNTRLFVLDADLLMASSGEGRELAGTLAVTTYPLIATSKAWVNSLTAGKVPLLPAMDGLFPSRISEGFYNAVNLQLFRGGARSGGRGSFVNDPGPRIMEGQPVWITMVGRSGFWPVSVKPQGTERKRAGAGGTGSPTQGKGNAAVPGRLQLDPPDVVTELLEGMLLLWGVIHLLGMFGLTRKLQWLEQFTVRNRSDESSSAQYQTYYLTCATLSLSAMLCLPEISALCLWAYGNAGVVGSGSGLILDLGRGAVAGALLIGAAGIVLRHPSARISPRVFLWTPWLIYILTVVGWGALSIRSDATGLFFSQRAVYLSNGVSPLLPVEFLLLIYYAWGWSFIRKVRLSESKQVRVPDLEKLGLVGEGFEECCSRLVTATDSLVFNPRIALWMALVFVGVVALLMRPWEALLSVEGTSYDRGLLFLFLYICTIIVLVWGRYMYIWDALSRVLRGLERTPLRRAFSRLPPNVYSWSPLWYEDAQRRAYTISARSLECFRAIVHLGGYGCDAAARLKEMSRAFQAVVTLDQGQVLTDKTFPPGYDKSKAVADLQRILVEVAENLLRRRLVPRWVTCGGSDTLDTRPTNGSEESSTAVETPLDVLEEEFVALRYVGLIHYESAQLKNIVVLLAVAFVLALLSIGSYPFLSGRLFVWAMALVFVLFGAGIITSFAQMARDAILSRLSGTDAGKLDVGFYLRALSYGAIPLLALLASQFPALGRSLISWLEPALSAMH